MITAVVWVLIVSFSGGFHSSITVTDIASKESCMAAASAMLKQYGTSKATCIAVRKVFPISHPERR